jgi:probable F420-dependent oxidoreductase
LWIPGFGSATLDGVERLLAATTTMTVATGILNIWAVPATDAAAGCARLRDAHGDRILLGLGVSHAPVLAMIDENLRYERPLAVMNEYLDALDGASPPLTSERRVLAALGPKMLELAARRSGGAHPYNVTPEHTVTARAALGEGKLLIPEQAVALTTDASAGRHAGRTFLEHYLTLPNYANNLRRIGFSETDLADGGSDRLVDALIAWGDEAAIAARVQAHLDAGADSVCIQVVSDAEYGGMRVLHRDTWRALAPALTSLTR